MRWLRAGLAGAVAAGMVLAAAAQMPGSDSNIIHPTVHQHAQFVLVQLRALNISQITMARTAARSATTAPVRRLATLVLRDRTLAGKKIREIALRNSLALNGPLPAGQQPVAGLTQLAALPPLSHFTGSALDAQFLQRLQMAIGVETQLMRSSEAGGPNAPNVGRLQDLIHDQLPILHQEQTLAARLSGS